MIYEKFSSLGWGDELLILLRYWTKIMQVLILGKPKKAWKGFFAVIFL